MENLSEAFRDIVGASPVEWFRDVVIGCKRNNWRTYHVFTNEYYMGCTLDGPEAGDDVELTVDIRKQVLQLSHNGERPIVTISCRDIDDSLEGIKFARAMNPDAPIWGWLII